jgi:Tol biopolymer transport system component
VRIHSLFLICLIIFTQKYTGVNASNEVELELVHINQGGDSVAFAGDDLLVYLEGGNLFTLEISSGRISCLTDNDRKNILRGKNEDYFLIESTDKEGDYHQGDIFLYDRNTVETRKVLNESDRLSFDGSLGEKYVVWNPNEKEIILYEIGNGLTKSITCDAKWVECPSVNDNYVAWRGSDGEDTEIFLYNIIDDIVIQVTNNTVYDGNPKLTNDILHWDRSRSIVIYALLTGEETIIESEGYISHYEIRDDYVVRSVSENGHDDIYLYDRERDVEIRITENEYDDRWPKISGNGVVWFRPTYEVWGFEIYLFNISTGCTSKITDSVHGSFLHGFRDDIVVWRDQYPRNENIMGVLNPRKYPSIYNVASKPEQERRKTTFLDNLLGLLRAYVYAVSHFISGVLNVDDVIKENQTIDRNKVVSKSTISYNTSVTKATKHVKSYVGEEYYNSYFNTGPHCFMYKDFDVVDSWIYKVQFQYRIIVNEFISYHVAIVYFNQNFDVISSLGIPTGNNLQPFQITEEEARILGLEYSGIESPDKMVCHMCYSKKEIDEEKINRYIWLISVYDNPSKNNWIMKQVMLDPITGEILDIESHACSSST